MELSPCCSECTYTLCEGRWAGEGAFTFVCRRDALVDRVKIKKFVAVSIA